jgi:hypothetical protein
VSSQRTVIQATKEASGGSGAAFPADIDIQAFNLLVQG